VGEAMAMGIERVPQFEVDFAVATSKICTGVCMGNEGSKIILDWIGWKLVLLDGKD
jgi:hypothetical protein